MKKFRIWNNDQWLDDAVVLSKDGKLVDILLTRKSDLTNAVVQYSTGLLDKNQREIYEGDIVKTSIGLNITVEFSFGYFSAKFDEQPFPMFLLDKPIEVVGNIFENPELIGK